MTTRHTITHADELYSGNAYLDAYSPDGRRGIKRSHLVLHHIESTAAAAPATLDADGIVCSTVGTFIGNWLSGSEPYVTGALVSEVGETIVLDVPRCLQIVCCTANASTPVHIKGTDTYGQTMYEVLCATTAQTAVFGNMAFKTITEISCTGKMAGGRQTTIGTSDKFGLPFNITNKNKIVALIMDGQTATVSYAIATGQGIATTTPATATFGSLDVRGTITPGVAANGTRRYAVLMEVDASTRLTAFGQVPNATGIGAVSTPT